MAYAAWSVVAGEQPTAAKWNILGTNDASFNDGTGIGTGAIGTTQLASAGVTPVKWTNPYKFSAYCSTGKGIANQTIIVDLQTELFDSNNNFASSRYTAPVAGFYWFYGQVWFGSAGMGTTEWGEAQFYKNGSAILNSDRANGSGDANRLSRGKVGGMLQLAANDYIEMFCAFSGSRDIVAGQSYTYLMGFLVTQT